MHQSASVGEAPWATGGRGMLAAVPSAVLSGRDLGLVGAETEGLLRLNAGLLQRCPSFVTVDFGRTPGQCCFLLRHFHVPHQKAAH